MICPFATTPIYEYCIGRYCALDTIPCWNYANLDLVRKCPIIHKYPRQILEIVCVKRNIAIDSLTAYRLLSEILEGGQNLLTQNQQ